MQYVSRKNLITQENTGRLLQQRVEHLMWWWIFNTDVTPNSAELSTASCCPWWIDINKDGASRPDGHAPVRVPATMSSVATKISPRDVRVHSLKRLLRTNHGTKPQGLNRQMKLACFKEEVSQLDPGAVTLQRPYYRLLKDWLFLAFGIFLG